LGRELQAEPWVKIGARILFVASSFQRNMGFFDHPYCACWRMGVLLAYVQRR